MRSLLSRFQTNGMPMLKAEHQRPEERPSLQFIALLLAWWVALSLGWIGTPIWIWLGGGLLLTAGHVYSWVTRSSRSVVRSVIVGVAIVGVLVLVPKTIMLATSGDWLPVAHFLLLFQGITAFEMRSRGGLYATLGISGAIFFFVSQQALDLTFAVFLTGFTTLLLSFFALSFLIDQVEGSDVKWFKGRLSFAWFWTGVFLAAMLTSAAIFLLLPKNLRDPIESAQAVVLPMRASGSLRLPDVSPEIDNAGSALPLMVDNTEFPNVDTLPDGADDLGEAPGESFDTGTEDGRAESGGTTDGESLENGQGFGDEDGFGGIRPGDGQPPRLVPEGELVMQVRSPVITYWRAQAYDRFDGRFWSPDESYMPMRSRNGTRTLFTTHQPRGNGDRPLYNQTYFIKRTIPDGELFTGYAALVASVPNGKDGTTSLRDGVSYRVISSIPEFNAAGLAKADPSTRLKSRYHDMPRSAVTNRVAAQLSSGVYTDIDRVRRIVAYLDRKFVLDENAEDQMALSKSPEEFLRQESNGTIMDFATATVLLARSAGMPARLVTGYLPGQFDPLSGTYLVREKDKHAWAEIYFGGLGWVPFDSSPRPATRAFGEGGTIEPDSVHSMLNQAYGENVLDAVKSSPRQALEFLKESIEQGGPTLAGAFVVIALASIGVILYLKFISNQVGKREKLAYATLEGYGRKEVLKTYSKAEKLLRKAGLASRPAAVAIGEYSDWAQNNLGSDLADLAWLKNAAWRAAYDPTASVDEMAGDARKHLDSLRSQLKEH